ncbi:Extradiol ring-cleavage dioxygenase, class III enzyme, subunit B [Mycena alexandri]|uniref:Extradiol ring-cleavage dioxygenase, class III enzyme, subunit B n=1 Tax=Mycena alexandri TaxID=1745969 RepID=A0AAD6TG26_9AGAR|nr:Extradiol ring-cleavage dioxygenase, class III enzyme, subunit B [Mycena alexandri]
MRRPSKLSLLFILSIISAFYLAPSTLRVNILPLLSKLKFLRFSMSTSMTPRDRTDLKDLQTFWRKALDDLPATPEKIPAFFFGHGSPLLVSGAAASSRFGPDVWKWYGPEGPLATFLKDFGPALLKKYQPKGIVVFSAHWETDNERLVTDYGDENPLLMDYYNFSPDYYQLKFKSKGDSALSKRVVELYQEAGQKARLTPKSEARGDDGRGYPGPGLDHGVFIPFKIMFGEEYTEIPIVQVSIDSGLSPGAHWALGKAVAKLREEGILVLSGGLTFHNLRAMAAGPTPLATEFDDAILASVVVADESERKQAMINLTKHAGFRACHPREEHFMPIYVAAGAGEGGEPKVIADIAGCETVAFGL